MVTVSCAIPAINFLAIDEIAKNTGRSISDLIKEKVIQEFPVESNQLKFNFEEIDDNSQQITESRIQKLATDETNVPESTICRVQKIRRPRNINLSNVDKILCKFSARHGADTG
jgi:hypothetical protein